MTTTQIYPEVDEARIEMFVDRFMTDLAGGATTAMTIVGDRLGLYDALTGAGPMTAPALAAATATDERLVTEWLASQTVSGYVRYDPEERTYELPTEHAMVLSVADSPAYVVAVAEIVGAQYALLSRLCDALRDGGGIPWDALPDELFDATQRYFRTAYTHELLDGWLPAIDGLVDRLEAGATVVDAGCGHGVATLLMARRWRRSTFVGIDLHEPSVLAARANAVEAGSPPNVSFRAGTAEHMDVGAADVVMFFDALHDMGDPPAVLRRSRELLTAGGMVVVVEPWSLDRLEDGIGNPSVRLDYAISTSLCTPASQAQPGAYALGTQGGPARRLALLADAGFRNPTVVADTGVNLVLAAST